MMDWLFEEKRITVIIPVYNAEKYLKRSIDSVIAQTYKYSFPGQLNRKRPIPFVFYEISRNSLK